MMELKEQIKENLDHLNEDQLKQVADFTSFIKMRARIKAYNMQLNEEYENFSKEDAELAEAGLEDYNKALIEEDNL